MDEIKPVKIYFISFIFFVIGAFGLYISLMVYISYFLMGDMVRFSFPYACFILGWPLLFNFSFIMFMGGYTKKKQNVNWSISNYLGVIAISGIIISLIFSFYVAYDLNSKGYVTCPKKSMLAPTEYVISKDICK